MAIPIEVLLVGRTIVKRYRIEEPIGRGGMSVVFRATDARLGRPVALKVVSLPTDSDARREELRARLRREAAAAARIPPHPNVVQVYDYGTDPELDLDFIAMEIVPGRDLKTVLSEGAIPRAEGLRIVREAAAGIAAGHRAGIVHRDVKPGNIVLTRGDIVETVKILDFGIAKALEVAPEDELTRTGHAPHSPGYASPEQLRGGPVTPASDVYQLGLVAYELLAGERPFTVVEREAIRDGRAVPLPERGRWREIPEAVRRAVARALDPEPGRRPADAAAFAEALAQAGAAEPEAATRLEAPPAAATEYETATSWAPPVPPPLPHREVGVPARPLRVDPRLRWVGIALAVLLCVWLVSRLGGGRDATVAEASALPNRQELDAEFQELTERAYGQLTEESSPMEGAQAAEAAKRVLYGVYDELARGDIEDHISYYDERVSFYGRRSSRERVARERAETLAQYPKREITISDLAISVPEPGEALALYNLRWEYSGGDEGTWEAEARMEMRFELKEGRWVVTTEREREVIRSNRR